MSGQKNALNPIFTNRLALNLYFWLGFILVPLVLSLGNHEHDQPNVRAQIFFSAFYGLIVYWNILWLMPRLFKTRQYLLYFAIITIVVGLWAIFQVNYDYFFYGCNCQHPLNLTTFSTSYFQIASFVVVFSAAKLMRDSIAQEEAIKRLERQNIEIEKQRVETELSFLKDQVNPHFLFNTLNTLYSFALEKSPLIPDYILKLSGIMRYMLYESNSNFVSLDREIQYLENYIALQEIRLSGRGEVILNVEGIITDQKIAPLMLITFVENCFKHSMAANSDPILIKLNLEIGNEQVKFIAENTFAEISLDENPFGGIGLDNVKKRLELLYPNQYELQIKGEDKVFKVDLKLSLKS